jgi:transposase
LTPAYPQKNLLFSGNITFLNQAIGICFAAEDRYMKSARSYKALYHQSAKESVIKDRLIVLLHEQVMQLTTENQTLRTVNTNQAVQIKQHQKLEAQQQATILGQAEKLSVQQNIITEQKAVNASQQKELDKSKKEILRLDNLRFELMNLKKWIHGIRSEKRHQADGPDKPALGDQLSLAMDVDSWGVCKISIRRKIQEHLRIVKTIEPKKRGGRNDFPEGLEEKITIIDAPEKPGNAKCIGYVDQRQLACDPMRWYIQVNRRLVYMVPKDEDNLDHKQLIAPLPPHPINKCKVDISVLVLLTIEKFLYHLPVWRQRQRLRQYGIDLPYSTMCYLVNKTCEVLEPLWQLLLKEITQSGLVNLDETRYRVLDDTKKKGKKSHIGWMWACLSPIQSIVCFLYQKGRGKNDISAVLQGYKGHLMTDAYGAYTKYGKQPGVVHQHCLLHARRHFLFALSNDAAKANYALDNFFGPLYGIEQECKLLNLDFDAITEKRQCESLPVLKAFRHWLEVELPKTTPRTPIYKAIAYTLNNFKALAKYTEDGMLSVDNNLVEGQIRSIALGRHNHMFAGSHRGGELAAIIYSFMSTCKLQKLDPAKWLDDVLRRIPEQPEEKLIELLPQFWKPLKHKKVQGA